MAKCGTTRESDLHIYAYYNGYFQYIDTIQGTDNLKGLVVNLNIFVKVEMQRNKVSWEDMKSVIEIPIAKQNISLQNIIDSKQEGRMLCSALCCQSVLEEK